MRRVMEVTRGIPRRLVQLGIRAGMRVSEIVQAHLDLLETQQQQQQEETTGPRERRDRPRQQKQQVSEGGPPDA